MISPCNFPDEHQVVSQHNEIHMERVCVQQKHDVSSSADQGGPEEVRNSINSMQDFLAKNETVFPYTFPSLDM